MDLKEQLDHLDRTLLSGIVSTFPEPLPDGDRALAHAYLVLAHAVLEEALEEVFEKHYDRLASWLNADMVPLEAAKLVYAAAGWAKVAGVEQAYKVRDLHSQIAKSCRSEFEKKLGSNNGIKTHNVQNLAKLIGVSWEEFENELSDALADLTTLGAKRGDAGHLSPFSKKMTELTDALDPDDVRKWVSDGLSGVERISTYLSSLVSVQQPQSLISNWDGN